MSWKRVAALLVVVAALLLVVSVNRSGGDWSITTTTTAGSTEDLRSSSPKEADQVPATSSQSTNAPSQTASPAVAPPPQKKKTPSVAIEQLEDAKPKAFLVRSPSGLKPEVDPATGELPAKMSITLYEQPKDVIESRGCTAVAEKTYSKRELNRLSGWGKTAVPMARQRPYRKIMGCLGDGPMFRRNETSTYWSGRSANYADDLNNASDPWTHPVMNIMAGGMTPSRGLEHAMLLGELMGVPKYLLELASMSHKHVAREKVMKAARDLYKSRKEAAAAGQQPVDTIVELGCGNGALLGTICPPLPGVQCYCIDIAVGATEYGRRFIPNINFEVGIRSKEAPCGSAAGVFSNAVIFYLDAEDTCSHIREALRMTKPNGTVLFFGVNRQPFVVPKYSSFFAENRPDGSSAVLQFCTGNLAALVSSVEILAVHHMPMYPASMYDKGYYGVRITRNDVPYPSKQCSTQDGKNKMVVKEEVLTDALLERFVNAITFAAKQRVAELRTRIGELKAKEKRLAESQPPQQARNSSNLF